MSRTLEIAFGCWLATLSLALQSHRCDLAPGCAVTWNHSRHSSDGRGSHLPQTLPRLCGIAVMSHAHSRAQYHRPQEMDRTSVQILPPQKRIRCRAEYPSPSRSQLPGSKESMRAACRFEANLGRLRFVLLGSILAPIKRTKSGRLSELCLAESTDSLGRLH
jgi:hypothetical protein